MNLFFDKLGSGDASDSDWTPRLQLLPYNKECVCLPVVKHSNTGRLRQEGTLHSAQLRGLLTGTVIRGRKKKKKKKNKRHFSFSSY